MNEYRLKVGIPVRTYRIPYILVIANCGGNQYITTLNLDP